jgi:hypothetical protein
MDDDFKALRQSSFWPQVRHFLAQTYAQMVADIVAVEPGAGETAVLAAHREAVGAEKMLRKLVRAVEGAGVDLADEDPKLDMKNVADVRKFVYEQTKGA